MTADGGSTWTRRTMPVPNVVGGSYPLACPDALTCYMPFAGAIWRTRDGGATWEQGSGDGWPFIGLACPATSVCYAVGVSAKVVKTTDGHTWAESTPFTRNWLYAIACASAQACAAVGYAGTVLTTSDRGATWVRRSSGEGLSLTSIACPSARVCFAGTGGYAYGAPDYPLLKSTDAGQTWVGEDRSANPVAVASVACPRADLCLAAAMKAKNANPSTPMVPVVLRTSNGGRTWTDVRVPSPLTSIACATAHRCVAVGGVAPCTGDFVSRQAGGPCSVRGWLYTTSDAGLHWRRTWAAAGRDLLSVTCASATQCYAGGFWVWGRSADGGKTWSIHTQRKFPVTPEPAPSLGAPADFVRSISCPSATTCWAIAGHLADANGLPVRTTDGGRTWQVVSRNVPPFDPNSGSGGLAALACPAQDRCYAVGGAGLVMAYAP
jgi:photosystem II stability/assembly factor-like uncharacterized protein